MPPRYGQNPAELTAVPVEQYRQQEQIYQAATSPDRLAAAMAPAAEGSTGPAPSSEKSTMLYVLVVAALAGVGWWAYKAMEKDRKFKLGSGPRKMQEYEGAADEDDADDDRDSESDSALDAYADADVDEEVRSPPHEKGGIKLVKG